MSSQSSGKIVADYLDRFPHLPSRAIARHLVAEHPGVWRGVESARNAVRNYRGNCGARNRSKNIAGRSHYRPPGAVTDGFIPLPPPLPDDAPWHIVPITFKRALLISDIHVPFHDAGACQLALAEGRRRRVDCVIINGDLCDFYALSFWERDPRHRNFKPELETARRFLEVLRDTFPKARIIFKEGNHEERLWRRLWQVLPEFAELPEMSLATLLDLDDYGIELVANKQPIRCGDHLHILHGHEFRTPMTNPVNPARGLYLRAKCNAICGDLHQTSQHSESGLTHVISCWSLGCLSNLHPLYMPLNKWNHGFALIEFHGKNWSVENKKIINGAIV